jgi:hypothetical protein
VGRAEFFGAFDADEAVAGLFAEIVEVEAEGAGGVAVGDVEHDVALGEIRGGAHLSRELDGVGSLAKTSCCDLIIVGQSESKSEFARAFFSRSSRHPVALRRN